MNQPFREGVRYEVSFKGVRIRKLMNKGRRFV